MLGRDIMLSHASTLHVTHQMKDSGCCGASEFVKLWAYTLTQYHRVVHLDMDTILYRNIVST